MLELGNASDDGSDFRFTIDVLFIIKRPFLPSFLPFRYKNPFNKNDARNRCSVEARLCHFCEPIVTERDGKSIAMSLRHAV